MSTSPVNTTSNAANAAANATSANSQAQQTLNSNYTQFLQLLTTQLQNQDPTDPTDTNQLSSEIAQMSMVQGQIQTNTDLAQLITLFSSQANSEAVSYIGKEVDAANAAGSPAQTELTGGQATLVYNLPAGAASATVTITNSAGQTVFTGPGSTVSGRNEETWAGTNSTTGQTVADGTYNFTVTAQDSSGNALTATTLTTGTVQSVDTQNGATTLSLGGTLSVPLSSVQAVYAPSVNSGS